MKTNPNHQAFPDDENAYGLTKLEYMATAIAAGLSADPEFIGNVAEYGVSIAKELIQELNK